MGSCDFFGHEAVIHSTPRKYTAIAKTACELLSLSVAKFEELLDYEPNLPQMLREQDIVDHIVSPSSRKRKANGLRSPSSSDKSTSQSDIDSPRSSAFGSYIQIEMNDEDGNASPTLKNGNGYFEEEVSAIVTFQWGKACRIELVETVIPFLCANHCCIGDRVLIIWHCLLLPNNDILCTTLAIGIQRAVR